MSKKVTVTLTATYDLSDGEIADEYREQIDDYADSRSQREWFAIDRMIGHDNLKKFDSQTMLMYKEEKVV